MGKTETATSKKDATRGQAVETVKSTENQKFNTSAKKRKKKAFKDMSKREVAVELVKVCKQLAVKHNLEGILTNAKDGKALASSLNPIIKPEGKIEACTEEEFNKLLPVVRRALVDIKGGTADETKTTEEDVLGEDKKPTGEKKTVVTLTGKKIEVAKGTYGEGAKGLLNYCLTELKVAIGSKAFNADVYADWSI